MTFFSEQEHPWEQRDTERERKTAWVIFDLDGVLIRWPRHHLPNEQEQANFFAGLQSLHESGVGISVLTNRPPAAMQILAYQLGVNHGVWVTESGGSAYNVSEHKGRVLTKWIETAVTDIPHMRSFLEQSLDITGRNIPAIQFRQAQFEPGMGWVKTVIVPPEDMSPQEYYQHTLSPLWNTYPYASKFTIGIGKAIDIDPVGLSKSAGMNSLLALNDIDPHKVPTLFIADATRDIPAGTTLLAQGGFVGAVGNASPDFKEAVSSHPRGISAPTDTSYHGSVIHIVNTFLSGRNA